MGNFNAMHVTFGLYLIVVLLIGIAAYFSTRDFGDYILGGRSLGPFVTAMSAGASDMSGWLLMGLPGAVFLSGLSQSWIAIGLTIGAYLNWLLVAGRLRVHTEFNNNALTLPDYFFQRFGSLGTVIKVVSATIILFFFTIYCASGIVAGARLFESLFHVSYTQAMWLGAGATIVYTFLGGFLAVSWTDTVQATLMIFALILTPVMVLIMVGGPDDVSLAIANVAQETGKSYSGLFAGTTFLGIVSTAAWGLGYFGQPHILARFMAAENVQSLKSARRIGMTWMILCLAGAVAVGYFGIAYAGMFGDQLNAQLQGNHERIFIALSTLLFNPWIAGIILSAILAAVMSTLSCQLLVCSSAIAEDFYKGFLRPTAGQSELVWIGRLMVLAVAMIAIIIAADPNSRVLGLVSYAWAGFGAAFGPVVIFSLFWKRMTAAGALAGMIVGAVVVVAWAEAVNPWLAAHDYATMYEIVPGFIACALAIVLVSLLSPAPARAVIDRFEQADREYHNKKHGASA